MTARATRLLLGVDSAVWGGAEAYVGQLLKLLPPRFECTVLAVDPVPPRLVDAARERGRLVVTPPVRSKGDLAGLRLLRGELSAARPDLVHVNQSMPTNNRHLLLLALAQRRAVIPALHLWAPLGGGLQQRLLRAAYRRSAGVVVVSAALRDRVVGELGTPPDAVHLVRNGVSPLEPAYGSGGPVLRVGALGRLVGHKGHDVLVEAVRRLVELAVPVEAVVAGEGPERAALERAAAGLPVRLLGDVTDPATFLRGLDVYVQPSRDEGLPLAMLEAMTAGLACVVTPVGDVAEAVGDAAVVVPVDDAAALAGAVADLAADPARRALLGARARERALTHFSAEAMVAATAAVYDGVRP